MKLRKDILRSLYAQHKEIILYVFFGGLTTVISILSFTVLFDVFCFNEHLANVISWILAVLFAFFTNRIWVFKSASPDKPLFFKQMLSFFSSRILTLGIEEFIVFIFISLLDFKAFFVKTFAQFIVIVLNYFVSKFWVFKKDL